MQDDTPNPPGAPPPDGDAHDVEARSPAPDLVHAADVSHLVSDAAARPAADAGAWADAGAAAWRAAAEAAPGLPPEAIARSRRALVVWLGILLAFGVGGLAFGQQELALLVVIAGVVTAAHAADFHRQFELLYRVVSVTLIGFLGLALVALGAAVWRSGATGWPRTVVPIVSVASALIVFATGLPPVARALAGALFGARGDSHSYRLAARLTLFGFLLAFPGWFATQQLLDSPEATAEMFSRLTLGSAGIGYVILALAAVGFLVRRDVRATLERLGLTRLTPSHLAWIAIGVPVLWAANAAGERGEHLWFPALWAADQRVNTALAGALSRPAMVLVAASAGVGEEITMRGALQPKLGIVLTALFFAALHVQYSWYGIAMIFAFGLLFGWIRRRTNTGVAIGVHFLYDLLALIAT